MRGFPPLVLFWIRNAHAPVVKLISTVVDLAVSLKVLGISLRNLVVVLEHTPYKVWRGTEEYTSDDQRAETR